MRERTTWDRNVIAKRAGQKKAEDPRAMNQDHLKMQPPMDKYVTGGPSEFAEDVSPSEGSWKSEYSDGSTDRNEIGAPEMRKDTFSHAEKTASDEVRLTKKANLCVEIAKKVLGKTASEQTIEDQAVAFMHIPDQDLIQTATRLAAEEEEEDGKAEEEEDSKEEQKKQAADDDQSSDDDEEEEKGQQESKGQQSKGQEQSKKQAQQQMQSQQQMQQLAQQALQAIDANDQQQAKQAIQQMVQQAYTFAQQQQGKQAQQQDVQSQVQQMIQEAMQQCQGQGQQQQAPMAQQDQMQAQQMQQSQQDQLAQQMQQQSQQQQMSNDDQLLDQMMMEDMGPQDQGQMLMASDVELEGAYMDLGDASGDDALRALFASGTEYQEAVQAAAITQGKGPQTKTARVLGTKPKGVSQLGGVGSSAASAAPSEVNKLTALWKSAPDVSTVFNGS